MRKRIITVRIVSYYIESLFLVVKMTRTIRARTMDKASPMNLVLDVEVLFDEEAKVWVADCETLCIVTEANTYESVTQQVRDLVPEMIKENNIDLGSQKIYLNFQHLDESAIA